VADGAIPSAVVRKGSLKGNSAGGGNGDGGGESGGTNGVATFNALLTFLVTSGGGQPTTPIPSRQLGLLPNWLVRVSFGSLRMCQVHRVRVRACVHALVCLCLSLSVSCV
jgi:hypothetical protein